MLAVIGFLSSRPWIREPSHEGLGCKGTWNKWRGPAAQPWGGGRLCRESPLWPRPRRLRFHGNGAHSGNRSRDAGSERDGARRAPLARLGRALAIERSEGAKRHCGSRQAGAISQGAPSGGDVGRLAARLPQERASGMAARRGETPRSGGSTRSATARPRPWPGRRPGSAAAPSIATAPRRHRTTTRQNQ